MDDETLNKRAEKSFDNVLRYLDTKNRMQLVSCPACKGDWGARCARCSGRGAIRTVTVAGQGLPMNEIGPVPPGTVRARCWCTWWIVVPSQIGVFECKYCKVKLIRAEIRDYEAVGITVSSESVYEPKRSYKSSKRKARNKAGSSGDNIRSDSGDDTDESGLWRGR